MRPSVKPTRPAERNRRRSTAQQVLGAPASAALLDGLRPHLDAAFRVLGARSATVTREWRRLLRILRPERDEFDALGSLDLPTHYKLLQTSDYHGFMAAIASQAQTLARQGVPEEHAVAALAFSLEVCAGQVLAQGLGGEAVLALVRLTATVQRNILLGYREGRAEGWHRADEQERLRLSRDLHDEIGGDLVVLKLYIEMIAMELARGSLAPAEAKLAESLALIGRAIESVRRLTLDLGPAILEQLGFVPALRLYSRQFSERTGIQVQLQDSGLPEGIPGTHETALYRVLQGALSNVAKHAQATGVKVTLGGFKDVIVMVIEDDGAGFDVDRPRQSFGLTTMRDRIRSLGGKLHVESRSPRGPGRRSGTRIEIDLPVRGGETP